METESSDVESLQNGDSPGEPDISDVEQETSLLESPNWEEEQCQSLVSLAAKVTGKHYPCVALETHDIVHIEHVMKKLLFWTFPQKESIIKIIVTLNDDLSIWNSGNSMVDCVEDIHQVGFSISGIIKKDEKADKSTEAARVSLTFETQRVTSTCCSVCPRILWCRHIVALALYRIRHPRKVPIHLPVMDVLSSLSRHQLQKVMQYAIYDDPGGLIPRLFKYINDVRNPESDLNQIDGLPDPSFGTDPDHKSNIDLSIEVLQKDLTKAIQYIGETHCEFRYPPFNFVEKQKKTFHQKYFGKIKALLEFEETEIAGKLLIFLASTTFDVVNGMTHRRAALFLNWMVQDIERLFSCFIISYKGPIREKIIEKSLELNGTANAMPSNLFIKTSEWVTVKLKTTSKLDLPGRDAVSVFPNAQFYQPLCASLVQDCPSSFQDLMNVKQTNPLALQYKEPLAVMMLRFDSLLLLGQQERKLCRLGVVILQRLLNLTSKLSIVSPGPNKHGGSENVVTEPLDDAQPSSPKRPRLDDDEDDLDEEWQSLSKANVSYCLLYVCYALYHVPNMVEVGDLELSVVMNATLRAIEIGRNHCFSPKDSMSYTEYRWLIRMENTIIEKFAEFKTSDNQKLQHQQKFACQMYSSALREKGLAFYGNQLAVKLIKTLIQHESVVDPDMKLRLYVDILCSSSKPFMNLNIPDGSEKVNKYDLQGVYMFFFQKLFEDYSERREAMKKVLLHLEASEDISFITDGARELSKHTEGLNNDLKLCALRLVVRCIQQGVKTGDRDAEWHMDREGFETIELVAPDIDVHNCVTVLLSAWEDITTLVEKSKMLSIASIIGDRIKGGEENLSLETFHVLLDYLKGKYIHHFDVCKIFQDLASYNMRHIAIRCIVQNYENYSTYALLKVAKREHEHPSASDMAVSNTTIFSEDVFDLVTRAFDKEKLKNKSDSKNESPIEICDLLWCFSAVGSHSSLCDQFCVIAEVLSKSGCSADVLVGFLDKIRNSPPLLDHAKSLFGDQLVCRYYKEFDVRLKKCYHHSKYYSITQDMSRARKNCVKFVDNGGHKFSDRILVPFIRSNKGKKKLIELMSKIGK